MLALELEALQTLQYICKAFTDQEIISFTLGMVKGVQ